MDLGERFDAERSLRLQPGDAASCATTPASGECPADQGPVGVHEAQHTVHGHVVVEQTANDVDLLEYSVDEFAGSSKLAGQGPGPRR